MRGLVRDVISDFKSRNGLLAVDMVPDALHADLVSELKSAIDSQPSDTLISRFNASVEFGGMRQFENCEVVGEAKVSHEDTSIERPNVEALLDCHREAFQLEQC